MASEEPAGETVDENAVSEEQQQHPYWKFKLFGALCAFDLVFSLIFLTPLFQSIVAIEGDKQHGFYRNLLDLGLLSVVRVLSSGLALLAAYYKQPPERAVERFRPNGEQKTKEDLEQEVLEEPWWPWVQRFVQRPSLTTEVLAITTQILCVVKCLYRMNVEIGDLHDTSHFHPVFWIAVFVAAILSVLEVTYLDEMCKLSSVYAKEHGDQAPAILRTISSQLLAPLLEQQSPDEEQPEPTPEQEPDDENAPAVSDIGADTDYKAQWSDLLMMCYPDMSYFIMAFVFLMLAALAQVFIPRFLGNILDALAVAFANTDENADMNMWEVPHFMENIKLLVVASVLAGVFSGLRGSIFTVVGARVNVRLRVKLMDSLLSQDIGFFDVTKTGDITSRLSSDTTLVGDQVSLNVNVFLRSLFQAIGVLIFMFVVSWQLSVLAFISVPLITLFSKWYGNYVRALTKVMQKKLADGNVTSEAALGSMATVRAFDAAEHELREFEDSMSKYLHLNFRSAVAYFGYATFSTSLPQLVYAVVVYFGGMLVRNGDMTSGELVSFLLYLQSLSDAFGTIGWVFSSLMQAVGAGDKVFELMHRKPRLKIPTETTSSGEGASQRSSGILGIEATKVREQRTRGVRPENAAGAVELENVNMFYPARPKRQVLNGMSLKIEPGSIVALVGQSGGGKSSVMSLIQHLYEPTSGKVMLDGIEVSELSPAWMARAIATVSQEPTLFGRSIKRNIMYGLEGTEEEPTDEEIIEAAKLANAHDFIERMPRKYDTDVGERGLQLSGGQKQRIAIARALVRKPKCLLLDEATSALDAESEHLVQQAIDDMLARGKQNREHSMTVIIVAHRLSTVRSADRIFVIKDGEVVESGQHDALVASNGAYVNLIKRQMQAQNNLENGK